jgi:hypothetical protein
MGDKALRGNKLTRIVNPKVVKDKKLLVDKYGTRESWESNKQKLYKKGGKV